MLDGSGQEIVRHGASGFLGEMNLLTGQTGLPHRGGDRADALHRRGPGRAAQAAARGRAALRHPPLGLHPAARAAAAAAGGRDRDRRPARLGRDPAADQLRQTPAPPLHLERSGGGRRGGAGAGRAGARRDPPGADPGRRRDAGTERRRALPRARDRARAGAARGGRPAGDRRRPGGPRRRRLRRLGGARHAGRREHRAGRAGRDLAADRELPRLPGRDHRHRADQPRRHPGAQVQRPHRDAIPGGGAGAGRGAAPGPPRGGQRDLGPRRRHRHRRRIPQTAGRRPGALRGAERLLCRRTTRGADLRRPAGRGGRRRQLGRPGGRLARPRRRPGDPPAPARRPLGDDVELPDRGARPLRRQRPRPQRNRRAARRRTTSWKRSR